jgi:hypothetical protein
MSTTIQRIAVDASGDAFLWGSCSGTTVDFGCGALAQSGPNTSDLCIAKLHGADGSRTWARRLGVNGSNWHPNGPSNPNSSTVSVSSKGDVAFIGVTAGSPAALQIDTKVISNSGFVAQLDGSTGTLRWIDGFDFDNAIMAFSKQDTLAVTGQSHGTVDLGIGPMMTNGADSFVMLIAP